MLHNEIDSYTREILFYYLSGELDSIIARLKAKTKERLPDYIYDTAPGIDYSQVKISNSGHSDPVGEKATKIADFYLERQRHLNEYIENQREYTGLIR